MAVSNNFVFTVSTSTGTGDFVLSSVTGFPTFSDSFSTGGNRVFYYFIRNQNTTQYEVGEGHIDGVSGNLVRDNVISGTNGTNLVNFSMGSKDVTSDFPANEIVPKSGGTFTDSIKINHSDSDGILRLGGGDGSSNFSNRYQLRLGYNGNSSDYSHAIGSRHSGGRDSDNAIDFYLWDPSLPTTTIADRRVLTLDYTGHEFFTNGSGVTIDGNSILTTAGTSNLKVGNFEIKNNPNTNSLDFNYIG